MIIPIPIPLLSGTFIFNYFSLVIFYIIYIEYLLIYIYFLSVDFIYLSYTYKDIIKPVSVKKIKDIFFLL